MLKIENTSDMDEYLEALSGSLTIYLDYYKLLDVIKDVEYTIDDLYSLASMELTIESGGLYAIPDKEVLLRFFDRMGIDLNTRFKNKKTNSPSLDKTKVLEPMIRAGIQVDLLSAYVEYRSFMSYYSALRKYEEKCALIHETDDGVTIGVLPTTVVERENLRVYYKDVAIVSIPKIYSNIVTTPRSDMFIAWCDYPQADWRFAYNLFIRDEQNEQVMRNCEDAYEGLARLVEGDLFSLEEFKENRNTYKNSTLKTFYNSKDNGHIPTEIRKFYNTCPKYVKFMHDAYVLSRFRVPIPCTDYFGHMQLLPEASYPDAFISKALNTPIQTFTSQVVKETVLSILKMFWSRGYTKDDINVYYVRHDEPLFLCSKNIIEDAWIFKECSQIHIDGFTPIKLDFHYGRYYQESSPELESAIQASIEAANTTYSVYDAGTAHEYNPLPSVVDAYIEGYILDNNKMRVFITPHGSRDIAYYDVEQQSEIEYSFMEALLAGGLEFLGNPEYLLLYTKNITYTAKFEELENNTFVKMIVASHYDAFSRNFEEAMGKYEECRTR